MIRRWDKSTPPRGPFALNRDCLQAQGLIAWYPLGMAGGVFVADEARKNYMTSVATPTKSVGPLGEPILNLASASVQYLNLAAVLATLPFTMAGWVRQDTVANAAFSVIGSTANNNPRYLLQTPTGTTITASHRDDAVTTGTATSTLSLTAGVFFHACGIFTTGASRSVMFNGGDKVTETTSCSTTTVNNTNIGAWKRTAVVSPMNGAIGEWGFWNRALAVNVVQLLANPSKRFELWYPLRSKKWISMKAAAAAGAFNPYYYLEVAGMGGGM